VRAVNKLPDKPASRMRAENRREQILDVAIGLFSQKGFRGTTTKEIALAAGVNEAIIFRHFTTKRDLYSAILDRKASSSQVVETQIERAMDRKDDRAVFEQIAKHILDQHDQDDSFMRLICYSALEGHELAEMFHRRQLTYYYQYLAAYIKQRVADRAFKRIDAMTVVRAFVGMVLYHAQMNRFYGTGLLNISNNSAAKRFTDICFNGILAPAPTQKTGSDS
jgi:AcrR family transcriptional regulator